MNAPTIRQFLIAAVLTAVAAPSWAQQPSPEQASAIRQWCRSDYMAHCASVPTGGMASLQCLQQNAASLSPACGKAVAAVGGEAPAAPAPAPAVPAPAANPAPAPRAEAPAGGASRSVATVMRQECGMDYRRLCRAVRPGGGRGAECLADHRESLSPACREALSAAHAAR